ncbi:hypothetical protein [Hyphomicrobium methylovorum]|uniref:hypothetical protein n=1 Tax=Hyphomicrobium methylovorum TaxID=84 RepID=UPI0015E6D4D5|nr:hypothetical protein [Hyphomicrobium methylovorum]
MRSAGLKCVHPFPQRHPGLAHVLYIRDIAVREQAFAAAKADAELAQSELLRRTELEIEQIRSEYESALAEKDRAANAGETTIVSVEANLRRDLHALGSTLSAHDRESRALAGAAAKADTNSVLRELHHVRNAIEHLRADHIVELAERDRENRTHAGTSVATDANSVLRELQQQMRREIDNLRADQMSHLETIEARLKKGLRDELSKAVKQIEAFTFIQNYMAIGKGLPSFHGWPISPDIGQFLIERIGERRYDMIIEFGSGTSTALQARALEINRNLRTNQNHASSRTSQGAPSLCSFEHNPRFLRKTQRLLRSVGVEEHVELLHTPLKDWEDETGKYSYYDCNAALAALAKRLSAGGSKRILVLVDGPPGSTCLNARYPAVPLIFKHLEKHEIDLVLDDADRPDEKAAIALWRAHWKKRGISVREEMIASEKGLYFATNTDDSA